jgi:WD40 repeat protein/DNA-binding SARP family transcriptional activator
MEFRILGPLEVLDDARPVALGGIKARAVLAVLLLHPNESVNAERLSLALWGDEVPATAVKTVQVYVSRLRKAFGDPDALITTTAGYCLRVREDELDADRFARLTGDGCRALAAGHAERAATMLREALALWRGPPLDDLSFEPFAQAEIARLAEQRLAAVEARVEADLAAGRHAAVVGELRRLVRAHRARERLAGQLMLALYRCGRQADALEVFHDARHALLAEVGVEPGPELRRLEEAILRQDDSLESGAVASELPPELDVADAPPLVARDVELARLREHWERAREGCGALVTVTGVRGIGKSRLAAELAGELHPLGATVLYVDAAGSTEAALEVLSRAAAATTHPTLLVVDDADRAQPGVLGDLSKLARGLASVPVLALATAEDAQALAALGARESLALAPLAVDAVTAISARYAPARGEAEVPGDWLLQASAGVPGRIHDVARRWGQREARRRVGAVAGRAAAGRSELRSMELELTGDVAELQAARESVALEQEAGLAVVCPFKGLAAFEVADAGYFFGRERLVAQLVARLVGAPLLGIVGPSGSGKSSVLRAGLLPALASGVLPGSEGWRQVVLRPGEHPLRDLDAATSTLAGDARFVLAIDQFEETFTACEDERERAAFAAELVRMADAGPGVVVLAVRADHYGRCAAYQRLAGLLASNHVLVGPMRRDELRRAVLCPARRGGLLVEPELADALVADVEDEPGALPLLSAALLELWQHRDGRRLRLGGYERTGGVRGAVARLAEDAFVQLDERGRTAARDLVMRLVELRADGEVERRRLPLTEVAEDAPDDVARVLALFTDRRLLTVSTGTVEIAHEALLREWPRLEGWIDEDRDALRIQRGLHGAAREWQRLGHDEGALYRGTRLTEILEWRDARAPPLSELERRFLEASDAARARDRTTRQRRIRLLSTALGLLALATVAIVATLLFARREHAVAASRDLAGKSSALLATDPGLALATAFEALRRSDTRQAQNALRQATLEHLETRVVQAHDGLGFDIALSPDGRRVATAGGDGTVRVWSVGDGRRLATIRIDGSEARAVSFSRDGTRIAATTSHGAIAVAPAQGGTAEIVTRLHDEDFAYTVEFGAGDATLVIGTDGGRVSELRVTDGRRRELIPRNVPGVNAARLDRTGRRVVSVGWEGFAQISNVGDGDRGPAVRLDHGKALVLDAAFSPDGREVATVDETGALRLWSASTGEPAAPKIQIGDEPLASVRFSRDGRRLAVGGYRGVIDVLTIHGGGVLAELRGHHGPTRAAFLPGGSLVSLGEEDGTLRTWAAPAATVSTRPGVFPRFSRDGQLVVSGDDNGAIHVWNPRLGQDRRIQTTTDPVPAGRSEPRLAPGGDKIVNVLGDRTVRIWDVAGGRPTEVRTAAGDKLAAAIDPSGKRIAIGGVATLVIQRTDGSDRIELHVPRVRVNAVVFSPDGDHLLTGTDDETPRIWNAHTGRLERTLRGHQGIIRSVSYSNDGRLIASASSDGTIRVWPARGGDPVILVGHESAVNSAAFDDSGDRLVSAGDDGTVRVWDVRRGDQLAILHRYHGVASGADFGHGYDVVSAGDGIMQIASCEVCGRFEDALRVARARPQRVLSPAERRLLLSYGR